MRLEGTLDAFGLADVFALLSHTRKSGALHLRRGDRHGVVHLREGAITGARSDVGRQELGRRLVGSGLVDDEALASAAEQLADDPTRGLAALLADRASLDPTLVAGLAAEQATDAVFDLLRWPDGDFSFQDESDPDDLGARLPVDAVVEEGRRRLELWGGLVDSVPAPETVLRLHATPPADPAVTRDEWALLSLVDGHRSVADLVALAGRGEYAVVSALASLVSRGLLTGSGPADDQFARRQALLAALEGRPVAEPAPAAAAPAAAAPAAAAASAPVQADAASGPAMVIPQRREPFSAARRPDHADQPVALVGSGGAVGAVAGATALAPQAVPSAPGVIERDPTVDKTLLLRLIAGVRGL